MEWIEALAYGLSRGFWRAYFDAENENAKAVKEKLSDETLNTASSIAERMRLYSSTHGSGRPADSTSAGQTIKG